jgi:hypothetical protein
MATIKRQDNKSKFFPFNADPDTAFRIDADPDLSFHFKADQNPARILLLLLIKMIRICDHWSPGLNFEPPGLRFKRLGPSTALF